eukprot:CAMPEP_0195568228 /NCGR_PEP_ID=MMETSP0814-20130614/2114_1 /TAXON_ID=97485 /ORGANISM="Prymnesium parvum, Strain Texoma1" /LENGTH=93 /DNA_ID=CAMNT_0040703501 /DNA_START=285 /DNA_END=563 /DNA_ORIENTATION=+
MNNCRAWGNTERLRAQDAQLRSNNEQTLRKGSGSAMRAAGATMFSHLSLLGAAAGRSVVETARVLQRRGEKRGREESRVRKDGPGSSENGAQL